MRFQRDKLNYKNLNASGAIAPKAGGIVGAEGGGSVCTSIVRDVDGLRNPNQVVRVHAGVVVGAVAHPISAAVGEDQPVFVLRLVGVEKGVQNLMDSVLVLTTAST